MTSFADRWSFLANAKVELVGELVPDADYVFYALTPTRVLLVAKDALLKTLADLAPDELTVRETVLGEAASLASPIKLLGFAQGEEFADLVKA